jgi:hypothetical protein
VKQTRFRLRGLDENRDPRMFSTASRGNVHNGTRTFKRSPRRVARPGSPAFSPSSRSRHSSALKLSDHQARRPHPESLPTDVARCKHGISPWALSGHRRGRSTRGPADYETQRQPRPLLDLQGRRAREGDGRSNELHDCRELGTLGVIRAGLGPLTQPILTHIAVQVGADAARFWCVPVVHRPTHRALVASW